MDFHKGHSRGAPQGHAELGSTGYTSNMPAILRGGGERRGGERGGEREEGDMKYSFETIAELTYLNIM